jgi:hypothetical protein
MLRESVTVSEAEVDLSGLVDPDCKQVPGIPRSGELLRFVDTFMSGDAPAYAEARARLCDAIGERAMVDAVAVAANFQRLDRIADGTGIPSDPPMAVMQEDFIAMGMHQYRSASNTPPMPDAQREQIRREAIPEFRRMVKRASGVE